MNIQDRIEGELDGTGRKILATLQQEGRIPFSELGRRAS